LTGVGTFGGYVWNPILGSAATRIAVSPEGIPWVVDAAGRVFKYDGSSFVPILTRGCATDIGVGPNDSAWVIGCDAPVAGDRGVYYLVGSPASPTSQWSRFGAMLGKRISVSPEGVPWVVNSAGIVSRRVVHITPSSGTTTSYFVQIPTAPGECASSIGVGSQGDAWKLDCAFVPPYGYGIYHWTGSAWAHVSGLAVGISVESSGRPSVINQPGSIFTAGTPAPDITASITDFCVSYINQKRATVGLAPLARWTNNETCAAGQIQTDALANAIHTALNAGNTCSATAQNELYYFGASSDQAGLQAGLDSMWAEGLQSTPGPHYVNMTGPYTLVACTSYKKADGFMWWVQDFR
jgi:hypothetical protein